MLAVDNVQIFPREMYQEYMRQVLFDQIEVVVGYIQSRLPRLEETWRPLATTGDDVADSVMESIEHLREFTDKIYIDSSRFRL